MTPRGRAALRALAALAGSLLCLGVLAATLDGERILHQMRALDPAWFLLAAALGPLQILAAGLRWARVARALDVPLGDGVAVREVGVSTALNQLLPGGVAGDVVRVWRSRHLGALDVAVATVVDRALGLAVLILLGGVALLGEMAWAGRWLPLPSAVGAGALLALVVGVASPAGRPLRRALAHDGVWLVAVSGLLVASFVGGYAASAMAVGVTPTVAMLALVPLVLLAMALPLSFAGWGPREAAAALLWPLVGATPEQGVAIAAAYGLSVLLGALPGLLGLAPVPGIASGR